MTDFIDVVEHNPIVFVKSVCEAIAEGYAIQNTIPGYPQFGAYGNAVRMFKAEKPGGVIISADHSGRVEHYEPMAFMLLVQNFVYAGYTFKEGGNHFFDEKGLKSIEMELVKDEPKEEKPAKKAPAKKALKAEPTIDELKEAE
jgi:hypothetical protein